MISSLKFVISCIQVLAVTLTETAPSRDSLSQDEVRDIEKFVGDVMGCANIPGLALSVVRGDSIFTAGFGVADMTTGHPVDKRTIFNLGSTAKAFVPYILAEVMNGKENQDGRVKWSSTLKQILHPDPDNHLPLTWTDMTLQDMLVYKSGSSAADMGNMAGLPPDVTRAEMLRRLRFLPRSPEFRNSNHYSNYLYTIAGHLAERMTGMSWSDLVKVKVFDRLSMNTSTFAPKGMSVEDSALPYRFSKTGEPFLEQNLTLFDIHPFEPTGSIMSSAEDMAKWLRHLIHNLNFKDNDSGINMLVQDAFHTWVTVPGEHREGTLVHESEVALGYGMGWYASNYRGQKRFQFAGRLYAYSSRIWLFPESLTAIFVSINGPGMELSGRALDAILYHISDTVLRKSAWVSTDMGCCCHGNDDSLHDNKSQAVGIGTTAMEYAAPLEKYIGIFGNGLVGNLNIEVDEAGVLILSIGRNFIGKLIPGETESKLRFISIGPLLNTEEWSRDKTFEFLFSTSQWEVTSENRFDKVRIYVKEQIFYEFERGELFENMLVSSSENDRKPQDDARASQVRQPTKGGSQNYDDSDNMEPVKDDSKVSGNSESLDNFLESNSSLDGKLSGQTNSEHHENTLPYNNDAHDDSVNVDRVQVASTDEQLGQEINVSTSKPGNTSCSVHNFSIWLFLISILNILSKC